MHFNFGYTYLLKDIMHYNEHYEYLYNALYIKGLSKVLPIFYCIIIYLFIFLNTWIKCQSACFKA